MRFNHITISIVTIMTLLLSCSKSTDDQVAIDDKVEVLLSAGQASTTRTSIEDDLKTTRWSIGDEIALWATGADDGVARLSGELFTMRYYVSSYTHAEFSSSISPMDESQQYIYKAFYPYPTSVSGTNITYTLASEQSGEFDGLYDFRVADEVTGKALTETTIGGCNLSFRSLTHALRITIPEGENELGDDVGVAKLVVTLPYDAVGTLSMDMADTSATPTISSNAGSTVTLDLSSDPLYAGDGRYAWLFINPNSAPSGDIIISGVTSSGITTDIYTITIPEDHTFEAGCVTPINARIEEPYTINFKQGTDSYLGETAIKMTITTTDGSEIMDGKSSITMSSTTGNFSFAYTPGLNPDLASKSLTVEYESASAYVTGDNITIGTLTDGNSKSVTYNLPYLFVEDFSGISGTDVYDLSGLTSDTRQDLPGLTSTWTDGAIYGYKEGTAFALRTYGFSITYYGFVTTYEGFITLQLSEIANLKTTANVTLQFKFYADWKENKSDSMKLKISTGSNSDQTSNMTSYSDADYTNIKTERTLSLSGCSYNSEILWELSGDMSRGYNYDYVYIDNIKVSIVP